MNWSNGLFVGLHNLVIFSILPRECDMSYQVIQNVCCECESARVFGIPETIVFSYMTGKAQSKTGLKRDLIKKVAWVEYHETLLGSF